LPHKWLRARAKTGILPPRKEKLRNGLLKRSRPILSRKADATKFAETSQT
jgi:hypothetical protein